MKVETVTYQEPIVQRLALGKKPANVFNDDPQVSRDFVSVSSQTQVTGDTQTVWGDVPLKGADGKPQWRTIRSEVDLTPRSPWKYGAVAAALGAAVGALSGWGFASSMGISEGVAALSGGLGLGLLAGAGGALAVQGDQVKVVWNTHQLMDPQYVGYRELVGPGEKDGRQGYFHRFIPQVETSLLASYQTPQVVHYKQSEGETKP